MFILKWGLFMGSKIGRFIWVLSIVVTIVGLFLQTILIPIQDFDTISDAELKRIQMDVAINYPLGRAMLYGGLIVFFCSSVYLILMFIRRLVTKKVV